MTIILSVFLGSIIGSFFFRWYAGENPFARNTNNADQLLIAAIIGAVLGAILAGLTAFVQLLSRTSL